MASTESHIAKWFTDQVIFITGATGFMGKVLVEKLLRDCSDIKECYLLMRTKRGVEPEQRREDYINHMVFFFLFFCFLSHFRMCERNGKISNDFVFFLCSLSLLSSRFHTDFR